MDEFEFRIARLELKPGDILVVKIKSARPSSSHLKDLKAAIERVYRGPCLIFDETMDLAVLTREDIEQRSAPSLPAKELSHD
jgi:hypothetical protein